MRLSTQIFDGWWHSTRIIHPPFVSWTRYKPRAGIILYQPKTTQAQLYIIRSLAVCQLSSIPDFAAAFCMHASLLSSFDLREFLSSPSSICQRLPKRSLHALSRQALISFHVTIDTVELSRLVKVTLSSIPASRRFIQPRMCARFSTARPLASTW